MVRVLKSVPFLPLLGEWAALPGQAGLSRLGGAEPVPKAWVGMLAGDWLYHSVPVLCCWKWRVHAPQHL